MTYQIDVCEPLIKRLLVLIGLTVPCLSGAQTTSTAHSGQSSFDQSRRSPLKEILGPLQISHFNFVYGTGLDFKSNRTPDRFGNPDAKVQIVSQVSFVYDLKWRFNPVLLTNFAYQTFESARIIPRDPSIGFQGLSYEGKDGGLWSRFEFVTPATQTSREKGLRGTPQSVQVAWYNLPQSRLRFRFIAAPSISFFENGETSSFLYGSPQIGWAFSNRLILWFFQELYYEKTRKTSGLEFKEALPTNLAVSLRWNVNPDLWFQPFINLYPTGSVTLSQTHWGMNFGGNLK